MSLVGAGSVGELHGLNMRLDPRDMPESMDGQFEIRLNDAVPYDLSPEFEAIPLLRHDQVNGEVPAAAARRTGKPDSGVKKETPNIPDISSESTNKSDDLVETDRNVFYDWEMIPKNNKDDAKTGITFKGTSAEYIDAHKKITSMMEQKSTKLCIIDREITVSNNGIIIMVLRGHSSIT